jgi:uncharacterized coiled-coil DUF342 family protein
LPDEIKTKIAELNEELSSMKDERDKVEKAAYKMAEKRDRLHELVKNLRDEVAELRGRRDEINDRVKEMKQRRNKMSTMIREKLDQTKKINDEYRTLSKRKPSRSHDDLQNEVESVDWKIQTSSLTVQEDRELVEKVKQLELQLVVHRKLEQLSLRITQLLAEVRTMKSESQHLHLQLTAKAKTSQEIHTRMLEKIEESKMHRAKMDELHRQYLQTREKIRSMRDEENVLATQMRQLKVEIHEQVQREKEEGENVLREILERQAKEKLKRSGKLSWEEFQLLAEKGITEED